MDIAKTVGRFQLEEQKRFSRDMIEEKNSHDYVSYVDKESERRIVGALKELLPDAGFIAEEGSAIYQDEPFCWVVDPLDGTTEFIEGYNEFTVNIALMAENRCICAVVYVPYFEKLYLAGRGLGSFLKEGVMPDRTAAYTYEEILGGCRRLPLSEERLHPNFKVAVSRLHCTDETLAHIDTLREAHPDLEVVMQGSSYKFCMLAEGTVDYYVRTSPTYEWDTAAGELILDEAGGRTRVLGEERLLRYNEEELRNPWFYCCSKFCAM